MEDALEEALARLERRCDAQDARSASSGESTTSRVAPPPSQGRRLRRTDAAAPRRGARRRSRAARASGAARRRPARRKSSRPTTVHRRVLVDVRVVEQAEPELVAQQPPHRRVDAAPRAMRPERTSSTSSAGSFSPPNWSQPASRIFATRSAAESSSTPQHFAGKTQSPRSASLTRPQSVQTTPSKPYRSRSSPVITSRLKPKPTSSSSVPTGRP